MSLTKLGPSGWRYFAEEVEALDLPAVTLNTKASDLAHEQWRAEGQLAQA
jgi:hypothetical protein